MSQFVISEKPTQLHLLNSIYALVQQSSGSKKILQVTKDILILGANPSNSVIGHLEKCIQVIEGYEALRELLSIHEIFRRKYLLSLEACMALAFKVSYITAGLMILYPDPSAPLYDACSVSTILSWTLMAIHSKRKLYRAEIKKINPLKCDLAVASFETFSTLCAYLKPTTPTWAISTSIVMIHLFTKIVGVAAIIFKLMS